MAKNYKKIAISTEYITLGQLLKFADVISNGGDAKSLFYSKAKEMGLDPDEIVKAMRNA